MKSTVKLFAGLLVSAFLFVLALTVPGSDSAEAYTSYYQNTTNYSSYTSYTSYTNYSSYNYTPSYSYTTGYQPSNYPNYTNYTNYQTPSYNTLTQPTQHQLDQSQHLVNPAPSLPAV